MISEKADDIRKECRKKQTRMGGEPAGSSARKRPLADCRRHVRNLGPRSHLRYNDRQTAVGHFRKLADRLSWLGVAKISQPPLYLDVVNALGSLPLLLMAVPAKTRLNRKSPSHF
jgi:hypothetical protein